MCSFSVGPRYIANVNDEDDDNDAKTIGNANLNGIATNKPQEKKSARKRKEKNNDSRIIFVNYPQLHTFINNKIFTAKYT